MKRLLFLSGMVTLLTATGCIVPEGGPRGHYYHSRERYDRHPVVVVEPPPVLVRPPVVVLRPPEIIVR